ncbi:MAG: ATP-binding protein [Salinivirgaceae bacterium]
MNFKHFYRGILVRLAGLVVFSGFTVYLFFKIDSLVFSVFGALLVFIFAINTILYFNNINRWIAFFLLGIENEDTSLKIPTKTGNKAIDEVFIGMGRLNELFKQTKVEISTQEQYYRSIINQSATGLFSVNGQGRISITNPAAEKLTGIIQYHHVGSLSRINGALPKIIMESDEKCTASVIFENDKAQKLLFKLSCIKTSKETIRLVAVSDITKELDNREVDAWIKLARTLSHEIMNNITPITTLSKVIGGYFSRDGKTLDRADVEQKTIDNTVKGLEVIEERSVGLLNFVESYRKFTKLPEPHIKSINVSSVIINSILAVSTYSGFNRITVESSVPETVNCNTDENLLSQVIINILKNSLEALLDDTENREPKLKVQVNQNTEKISILISNNGPSIPPELREQIFVPFFTTKECGSGIGLSLSKQIMLKLGGDVALITHHDKWTQFQIHLPIN